MDQSILIARNQTAFMQLLSRHVAAGHYFWTADRIPRSKLPGFIEKWNSRFRLRADPPARSYRKRIGRASVHLCIAPEYCRSDSIEVGWWMLSTAGKDGLAGQQPQPGKVRDARTAEGRLCFDHYELLQQQKTFIDASGRKKTVTTWTWRLKLTRYREWESLIVRSARERDRSGVTEAVACLRAMPMFAGVRSQVIRLLAEANRILQKVGLAGIEVDRVPTMPMISLWADDVSL